MPPDALTRRQREIARLVAEGKSNHAIALELVLSERTVEHHVTAILQKTGSRSRAGLIAAVYRDAIDSNPPPAGGPSKHNLPRQLSSFVGRERELAEIGELVCDHRLVTLIGSGGVGKTRTAVELAAASSARYAGGAWFVELAPLGDATLVAAAIAAALGVEELPNRPLLETLVAYLARRAPLLVLDNCEHVVSEAAVVADRLLCECPGVRILATSREPLRISGERTYRLPPLGVPPLEGAGTLEPAEASAYAAVVLFADRARAVDRRFALTRETAPVVARICRRLDGISLAIELAAARVHLLPLDAIAERLDRRLTTLAGGDRTALPRHQTMRALIDWSYDLLAPDEQRLFEDLSVFAGGGSLEAVLTVCAHDDAAAAEDALSSLVDKSLVDVTFERSGARYRLLEVSRAYAREKLAARGEAGTVARRHAFAYVELAEHVDRSYWTEADLAWRTLVQAELDNWRAALHVAFEDDGDVILGQRLAGALGLVWRDFGRREGLGWLEAARARVDTRTPAAVLAKLDFAEAVIVNHFSGYAGQLACAERALARYRALNDRSGTALALMFAGHALLNSGRAAAGASLIREALGLARAHGNRGILAAVLRNLACCLGASGDFTEARTCHTEALAIFTALGADRSAAHTREDLACTEFLAGNVELALEHAADALAACRERHDIFGQVEIALHRSMWLTGLQRFSDAAQAAREALVLARQAGLAVFVATAVEILAAVVALRPRNAGGDLEEEREAARVFGFAAARLAPFGGTQCDEFAIPLRKRALELLSDALGSDELARLMAGGSHMTEAQASDAVCHAAGIANA